MHLGSENASRLDKRLNWLFASLIVLAVYLLLRPMLASSNMPAFNQDWTWPPDRIQAMSTLANAVSPFNPNNFGSLNYYMGSAPIWILDVAITSLFGTLLGLKVLLIAVLLVAAVATHRLAALLGADRYCAAAGTIVYVASPVVANELSAGHIGYLIGYSILPIIAAAGYELATSSTWRPAVVLSAVLPISVIQPQFIPLNAVIVFAMLFATQTRRARVAVLVAGFAALIISPFEVALALFAHPLVALSFDRTNLHWEAANSGPLLASFIGSGYGPGYDLLASPLLLLIRGVCGAALWMAAVLTFRRSRLAAVFGAVAILAALLCAGTNGPLSLPLSAVFLYVPQAALFRELYHFSGFVVFGLTVALAHVRRREFRVALLIVAVGFALPQLTASFWQPVGAYNPDEMRTISGIVARASGKGSVLFWPLLQPMGSSASQAGADPDAYAIGSHPSLSEFVPMEPLSQIGFELGGSPHPQRLLASFGVRFVVFRQHWSSEYFARSEPALERILAKKRPPKDETSRLIDHLHIIWRGKNHVLAEIANPKPFIDSRFAEPVRRLAGIQPLLPSEVSVDPSRAWVDATRWQWWDRRFMGPVNPALFSLGGIPLALSPQLKGSSIELNAPYGALVSGVASSHAIGATHGFERIPLPAGSREIISRGPTMVLGISEGRLYVREPKGARTEILNLPDSGWVLRTNRGRAMAPLPNSWDMKWALPHSGASTSVRRELAPILLIALFAQYAIWILSAVALLWLLGSRVASAIQLPLKRRDS